MAFEVQYKDDIQQRMKAEYKALSGKTVIEGGFARDIINANSIEFENTYLELNMIYSASFADTSWGDFLTRKCAEFGIDRKLASYSVGEVTFIGEKNKVVPANTIVEIEGGNQYLTDEEAIIDESGKVTVSITCTTIGSVGNVAENTITSMPYTIYGIKSVTNAEATHDGYDEESDDDLFVRYVIALRTPATSGNKYHYYNWASEVEGVGVVKIIPLWNGNGTVKVLFLDSNGKSASEELIMKVYKHIEEVRPIGATVTVVSASVKDVKIEVSVKGTLDIEELISDVMSYAASKKLELRYISASKVGDLIMNQDLVEDYDYESLFLNGAREVRFNGEEILGISEVVVSDYEPQ